MMSPFAEDTYVLRDAWTAGALAITDVCENPEVICAWADYFYAEEGSTNRVTRSEGMDCKIRNHLIIFTYMVVLLVYVKDN